MFSLSVGSTNITPRQFAVLSAVAKQEGINQMDIVDATGVDRSTTSELVGRLVKKGWLHRRRTKEDARAYAVQLTAAGRKALKIGEKAALGIEEKALAALSSRKHALFIEALSKIVQEFGAQIEHDRQR